MDVPSMNMGRAAWILYIAENSNLSYMQVADLKFKTDEELLDIVIYIAQGDRPSYSI